MTVTPLQIQALLAGRGLTGVSRVDYQLVDRSDGQGPQIDRWTVAVLGPVPTQAEIDAITPAQIAAVQVALPRLAAQAVIDAMPLFEKAIVLTILDQFNLVRSKLVPALPPITVPQMLAAVRQKAGEL